jgi:hypothetical protein
LDLGLKYTSELKNGVNLELRKLEDVEFLKRSFRWDDEVVRYVAPLRLSVVLEIAYWTKNKPGIMQEIVDSNVQVTLHELALHGRPKFESYVYQILRSYKKYYDKVPERTEYILCRDFVLDQELTFM